MQLVVTIFEKRMNTTLSIIKLLVSEQFESKKKRKKRKQQQQHYLQSRMNSLYFEISH